MAKIGEGPAGIGPGPSPAQRTTDRGTNYLPTDGRKRPVASIFTAPTSLSAHPAVLHVHLRGVALALLATQTTRFGASPKSGPDHRWLRLRPPGDDPPCRGALIRAVEAHGDAAPHMADHLLAEAGIGAGATRLGAVKACLYALDERIGVHYSCGTRVGVDHFPSVSNWGFPFPRTWVQCNKARKRS